MQKLPEYEDKLNSGTATKMSKQHTEKKRCGNTSRDAPDHQHPVSLEVLGETGPHSHEDRRAEAFQVQGQRANTVEALHNC